MIRDAFLAKKGVPSSLYKVQFPHLPLSICPWPVLRVWVFEEYVTSGRIYVRLEDKLDASSVQGFVDPALSFYPWSTRLCWEHSRDFHSKKCQLHQLFPQRPNCFHWDETVFYDVLFERGYQITRTAQCASVSLGSWRERSLKSVLAMIDNINAMQYW